MRDSSPTSCSSSTSLSAALEGRGGASSDATNHATGDNQLTLFPNRALVQKVAVFSVAAIATVLLSTLVFRHRDILLNKERIQVEALRLLESLKDDSAPLKSLALYSLAIAAWELCSLSTIPVETAAGMVFGWKAAPASVSGKLLGAGTAFALGRGCLKRWAGSRLESHPLFQLVTHSGRHSPWATAFLMKYSCFPEFVKNFGSSLLDPVTPLMFAVATLVHGGGFTLLWTWWGVDTSLRLSLPGHVTSLPLKAALIVAGFVGVVLTPLLMAWWINTLRQASASASSTPTKKIGDAKKQR